MSDEAWERRKRKRGRKAGERDETEIWNCEEMDMKTTKICRMKEK